MTFLSAELLKQRRELGLARVGGACNDSALLDTATAPPGDLQGQLKRFDELLKALWTHPSDFRLVSCLQQLVGSDCTVSIKRALGAAQFAWLREHGQLPEPTVADQCRQDYECLRMAVARRTISAQFGS